jgi:hypothetical protein
MAADTEVKHSAAWRSLSTVEVKHGGTWRDVDTIEVKHGGTWRTVFQSIVTPTVSLSSSSVSHTLDFTCWAQVRYASTGVEYSNSGGTNNYSVSRGNWKDSGDAAGAWIDHVLNSGSALYSRAQTPGTRAQMSANRDYRQRDTNSSASSVTSNITVTMYDAETGGSSLGSGTFSLTANYFNACPTCCFTPDTYITMACGMQVPIGQIRVGDEIVVYNPDDGTFDTEKVEQIITRVKRKMYRVTFEDGTVLHCSDDHPMHVKGAGPHQITPQGEYKYTWDCKTLEIGHSITCIATQWWGSDCAKITRIEEAEYLEQVYTLGNSYFFANNKLVY